MFGGNHCLNPKSLGTLSHASGWDMNPSSDERQQAVSGNAFDKSAIKTNAVNEER